MLKLKQMLISFMQGRYGNDEMYRGILFSAIALFIVNIFLKSALISLLMLALLFYGMWRSFSKNISARRAENTKYLEFTGKLTTVFKRNVNRVKDIKVKRYRRCPHCKTWLKFPVKKGTHSVTCPNCKEKFDVTIKF